MTEGLSRPPASSQGARSSLACIVLWLALLGLVALVGTGSVEVTWAAVALLCVAALLAIAFAIRARNLLLGIISGVLLCATPPIIVGVSYWLGAPR